ncbi:MAG: glutathione S-transferase family protein [Gammaproteobacteria bacterium]|nr:glutathione S-transferase family protein [Gammaproteobacteria bacterium]
MKPQLISFDLCPFVQRSVITLLEKHVEFDITYIDLAKPPQWFLDISPFGKVPALRVGDKTVFESAVINEYLDDTTPPSMHPVDPLQRAINKSWIEFASELLAQQYLYSVANTEDEFDTHLHQQISLLSRLEKHFGDGPFFNGDAFCLIEAAYAPFFTRAKLLVDIFDNTFMDETPKLSLWADKLVKRESVMNSVNADFRQKYIAYLQNVGGYASSQMAKSVMI